MIEVKEMDGELAIVTTQGYATTSQPIPKGADDNQINTLLAKAIREQRDAMLRACDWTQVEDCPMGAEAKDAWRAYRQALRDMPEQAGFPREVVYPAVPEEGEADAD